MKRMSPSLIALGLVSTLAVACAQEASRDLTLTAGGDGPSAPQVSDDPSAVAQRAVEDVTQFWRETYPAVYGEEFQELAGFYPYGPDTEMPPCGPFELAYEEIADNAFYCPDDDIIAWDEGTLMPQLNRDFGAFTVAIVIAHEYGHAAQARFGTADRTVDLELQADCFAGAWTQRVADGAAEGFEPSIVDLDKTVAGLISIRDAPGIDPNDPMAHGSGFDRVSAFQDGYENGAQKCAEYADESEDRRTAEIEDVNFGDTGGNLPSRTTGTVRAPSACTPWSSRTSTSSSAGTSISSASRGPRWATSWSSTRTPTRSPAGVTSCPAPSSSTPPSTARTRTSSSSTATVSRRT